jgi:hypothetical protein
MLALPMDRIQNMFVLRQKRRVTYMMPPMRVNFHHLESTDAADLLNVEKRFKNGVPKGMNEERERPGVVGYATALTTLENDCRVLGGCCEVHFDSAGARVGTIKP